MEIHKEKIYLEKLILIDCSITFYITEEFQFEF